MATEKFTDKLGIEHEYRVIQTAKDVTPEILLAAEQTFDGWFDNDEPIDWESFIDKLADPYGHNDAGAGAFDFNENDNSAIRKIQRHIRKYKSQG